MEHALSSAVDASAALDASAELQLTEAAVSRIRELREQRQLDAAQALRVRVESGGCSGFSYSMDFDAGVGGGAGDDVVIERGDVRVVVDAESFRYLAGSTLDYVVSLTREGFKFENPNASRTCGCGESFGV